MTRTMASALCLAMVFLAWRSAEAAPVNVAPLGVASSSSTGFGGVPSRANDGNTNGNFGAGSVCHSNTGDAAPWWEVDLGVTRSVLGIVLWNRTDCCSLRLSNFRVSLLDEARAVVSSGDFFTDLTFPAVSFTVPFASPLDGRFVRVEIIGPNSQSQIWLSLAEVQVFVDSTTLPLAIARQPAGGRIYPGSSFTFSVGLLDPEGATYQWQHDGEDIPGATQDNLVLCTTAAADGGLYTVVSTRGASSVTSDPAKLEIVEGNLARSGTATQSTTDFGGNAERGNDGNSSGIYGNNSVTHTATGDPTPWWEVQLLGVSTLEKILVWGRTDDCCLSRLSNFRVAVLGEARDVVFQADFFTDGASYPDTRVNGFEVPLPAGTAGRFVRVEILGPNTFWGADMWLSLAEVEAFGTGPTAPPDPNLARGRLTRQSSTLDGYPSSGAVNGSLGDFTHTLGDDAAPTWEVDLCADSDIGVVILHNRSSCCASRLRDITVSVIDAAGGTAFQSELLNPENALGGGQMNVGPASIAVDIRAALGRAVRGRFVRVSRTPDPDFSGSGGQGGADEANVLSLAEVEIIRAEPSRHVAGDCSLDGEQDVSDVVCYVDVVFPGFNLLSRTPRQLPCADGMASSPGNIAVLDVNGDARLSSADIVHFAMYLFLGGPPPTQGTACFGVPPTLPCGENIGC